MIVSITNSIEFSQKKFDVAGLEMKTRDITLAPFVAGYLQYLLISHEFQTSNHQDKDKENIFQLSHLVHTLCRKENYNFKEYLRVQ